MLTQQQWVLHKMIKYLVTVGDRMRELQRRRGVPLQIPDLPRDPTWEALQRRLKTLRTVTKDM